MRPFALLLPIVSALPLPAQAPETSPASKPDTRPATRPATGEREGVFVPAAGAEIAYWPEGYRDELRVLEVVAPGTPVRKGEVLLRIDLAKLEEQIEQARFEFSAAETKLADAREESKLAAEAEKQELARAELEAAHAEGRLKNHLEFQIPMKDEDQKLSVLSQQYNVDDQREEMAQLEKMYKEDDLTEATEEIVLKRSKRRLDQTLAFHEQSRKRRENEKEFDRARELESIQLDVAAKQGALSRLRRSQAIKQRARAIESVRSQRQLDTQRRKLADLEADLAALSFTAPRDGIVVHGTGEDASGTRIKRGGTVPSFQTFMVVAPVGEVRALLQVPEEALASFRTGQKVEVTCSRSPAALPGRVESVSPFPVQVAEPGKDAVFRVTIALERADPSLLPGLRCKVRSAAAATARADR